MSTSSSTEGPVSALVTGSQLSDRPVGGTHESADVAVPLQVIKRHGVVVPYDSSRIRNAMTKAYLAVEGRAAAASSRVRQQAVQFTKEITDIFLRRLPPGGTVHIEEVQDQVELALMRAGEHQVARAYVLYREEHTRKRQARSKDTATAPGVQEGGRPQINMILEDGTHTRLTQAWLDILVQDACQGLEVEHERVVDATWKDLFNGISRKEMNAALVLSARTLIEDEPDYTYAAARLLLAELRREALGFLGVDYQNGADQKLFVTQSEMADLYPQAFATFVQRGIELERLAPELAGFDLPRLAAALRPENDLQFTYLGLQTLYDRYFQHSEGVRFELPQYFFMRVAMGLALNEEDPNARAVEFYQLLSSFDYMSSTPTLFNSGTLRPQLSSCYLTTVPDDLNGIFGAVHDNAMLSKFAGGLGNDWTCVRAHGSHIKGTNGVSQGVVPFLKIVNDTAVAVNQGGKRKGAVCAYLEVWHKDIRNFLSLRKNTGEERHRTHDMHTANWIPDLFMKRVMQNQDWTLFSPADVADLHDLTGKAFEQRYLEYEKMADAGQIRNSSRISAQSLWREMMNMLYETGHPWITFKDSCNLRSPQQHVGVVHSSNLCTEITLNTSAEEIAVCNLGSVNLVQHVDEQGHD